MREPARVALGYRSIRVLRWIGFSEDDGKGSRRRRKYKAAGPQCFYQRVDDNAFHLAKHPH